MSKDTPATPDYTGLAGQQGDLNKQFALYQAQLARMNQITPYGQLQYQQDPNDPTKWTSTQELSPAEQDKYDRLNAITSGTLNSAQKYGLPSLDQALQTSFTPPREAQIGWDPRYGPDQRMQTESGIWELPWAQEKLDYSGAPAMPTPDDAMRQRVEQALYGREAQYLDPQFEKAQNRLDTKLANQGIFAGSEADKDARDVLGDQQQKAYADARMQAIAGGGAEQSNLFGMGLGARQQGVNELTTQGQFANQARGQLVQEMQNEMQGRNAAITGQANIAQGQQNAVNQGLGAWQASKAQQAGTPVNIMNAIMQGSQVNNPSYAPPSGPSIEPGNVQQAGQQAYQADLAKANASNAQKGNAATIAAGLGSAAIIAY